MPEEQHAMSSSLVEGSENVVLRGSTCHNQLRADRHTSQTGQLQAFAPNLQYE
jgi:hypothetical protein